MIDQLNAAEIRKSIAQGEQLLIEGQRQIDEMQAMLNRDPNNGKLRDAIEQTRAGMAAIAEQIRDMSGATVH